MDNLFHPRPFRFLRARLGFARRCPSTEESYPDTISLPDPLAPVRAGVLSLYETFEQHPPSAEQLEREVERVAVEAGSADRLAELVSSGRLAEVAEVRPFKLEMDLLNKCNLRCPMCMMSHPSHYRQTFKRMPLDVFERLAEEVFWHVKALSFTLGAEPLLHPQFARFLEIASRYRIPEIYAVTNGTLLTESTITAIITHGMHLLAVSIDAACPETYRKIRVGGDWDRLMHNLKVLQRIKRERGSEKPYLELAFVMMRSNIEELPAFVEMAAELGAYSVNTNHMVPFKGLDIAHESLSLDKEISNTMLSRARARAEELGIRFSAPALFGNVIATSAAAQSAERFSLPIDQATRKADHCPFPWYFAAIDMHGNVVPCGWWHNQPGMGNIYSESFLSIWKSESYKALRAEHESGMLRTTCSTCPSAGVGCVDGDHSFLER